MSGRPVEERLREVADRWTPSDALRQQVLGVAGPLVRPAVTWWDRVWFSRRWRLAAIATTVALVALDFTSVTPGGRYHPEPPASARETAQAADDAARQAGLGADDAAVLAQRAFVRASRPDPEVVIGAAGTPVTERGDTR